jgi:hypothetical protein
MRNSSFTHCVSKSIRWLKLARAAKAYPKNFSLSYEPSLIRTKYSKICSNSTNNGYAIWGKAFVAAPTNMINFYGSL